MNEEYLLDMMAKFPAPPRLFDPFRIEPPTIMGFRVHETPDIPVLQISPDFPHLSDKFRAEWNAWALERFGVRNIVPEGTAFMWGGRIFTNPRAVVQLLNCAT